MIETRQLTKHYGRFTAVDRIDFRVEPGEVLGFLGPNGAGKSTTMKMIAGFLAPSSGTATVCGHDVQTDPIAAKRALGYLPEGAPSYGEMSVAQFLGFIADVRGLDGARRRSRIDELVERLQLNGVMAQTIDTLSKGFKRRVGLAQALLHDPPALVLDEPTDGLDPNQKHEVRGLIQSMARNKIVIISTHILEEVHAVCTRAVVIARGRLLADATPGELEARSRYHRAVSMTVPDPLAVRAGLLRVAGIDNVEINAQDHRLTAFPKGDAAIFEPVTAYLREQAVAFSELQLERGRLDEVFRTITTAPEVAA
ncbi:MAG: ABC transporter ATP-binding protein [Lysobacteraceae bacterium]